MNQYQILSGLFENHIAGCRECAAAMFTGYYCDEGRKLNDERMKFFREAEQERKVAA